MHYHIPWTGFKSMVHEAKLQFNLHELMFTIAIFSMLTLKDNCTV